MLPILSDGNDSLGPGHDEAEKKKAKAHGHEIEGQMGPSDGHLPPAGRAAVLLFREKLRNNAKGRLNSDSATGTLPARAEAPWGTDRNPHGTTEKARCAGIYGIA